MPSSCRSRVDRGTPGAEAGTVPTFSRVRADTAGLKGSSRRVGSVIRGAPRKLEIGLSRGSLRAPPTPMGASGQSFGPLMNPSSETESPVRTFPMFIPF
jgi:hypothetical protein